MTSENKPNTTPVLSDAEKAARAKALAAATTTEAKPTTPTPQLPGLPGTAPLGGKPVEPATSKVDSLMTEAMRAAGVAMGKVADNPAGNTAPTSNGADKAPQGVTAATGDQPKVLADLTATAATPKVDVSAAGKGGKAKGGKPRGGANANGNGNGDAATGTQQATHPYDLTKWCFVKPGDADITKPSGAEIAAAYRIVGARQYSKKVLALASYLTPNAGKMNARDAGYVAAMVAGGQTNNNLSNVFHDAAREGWVIPVDASAASINPRNTGAPRTYAAHVAVLFKVMPHDPKGQAPRGLQATHTSDGKHTLHHIELGRLRAIYGSILASGHKVPRHMQHPDINKKLAMPGL